MQWLGQQSSIAGLPISNWMIVLGGVVVALLIYTLMQEPGLKTEARRQVRWIRLTGAVCPQPHRLAAGQFVREGPGALQSCSQSAAPRRG